MVHFYLDHYNFLNQMIFLLLLTALFIFAFLVRIYISTLPKRGDLPWLTEAEKKAGYKTVKDALYEKVPIGKVKLKKEIL